MITEITAETFEEEVLKTDGEVVVKFYYSSGCKKCDQYKPLFEKYAEDNPHIKCCAYTPGPFGSRPEEFATKLGITKAPSFIRFLNGESGGEIPWREIGVLLEEPKAVPVDPLEETQCDSCQ